MSLAVSQDWAEPVGHQEYLAEAAPAGGDVLDSAAVNPINPMGNPGDQHRLGRLDRRVTRERLASIGY
jgi:hypothetical protein